MAETEYFRRMRLYHWRCICAYKRGDIAGGDRWALKAQSLRAQFGAA